MKKLTAEMIERKLKAAHAKVNKGRAPDNQIKLENALGVRWYRKLKVFKSSNGKFQFDPFTMIAMSYQWWNFVCLIKGKVVFNEYKYSNTTSKHQWEARSLLKDLGIKIDAEVNMHDSLNPTSFVCDALKPLYQEIFELEIAIARKGSNKETNKDRVKRIAKLKQDIKKLRAMGARFSKKDQVWLRNRMLRAETYRSEQMKAKREKEKVLRQEIKAAAIGTVSL